MLRQFTPEKVIRMIKLSVTLCCCWPLSAASSRIRVCGYKVLQISTVISACLVLLPLLYSTYLHSDDIVIVSKCICVSIGMSQLIVQTLICLIKHDSLQRVVGEMVACVKHAQQYETQVFYKYIAKCDMFYGGAIVFTYLTATAFLLGPVIMPVSFPLDAEYPFRVNYTPVNVLIYFHQSVVSYQCSANVCLCIFGALLFWFTAARFECLAIEFEKSSNIDMLIACVEKQLRLRRYAEEVVSCFRFVVLYTVAVTTFAMILCGVIMIMDTPLIVKMQFITICVTVLTEVYMYAWPVDHMKEMSLHISTSAYNLLWYEYTVKMQKNLLNVLLYQEPVTFSISCLVPELSLQYYCSYLSNAFSIFTALRVLLENDSST
ncbi:odorant receptor 85b-like [Frieseomelitta varia]|uniref:odorant receptor 85b-like n=1 Tax=Frieseomelitta varia TaxID=561572 RepID=UPI001CB6AD7D|nr:odorant receptor 85b-like [Frieseomelitta varia]